MLLIIAIVGTTVAPWQLFFQQSYVIDKRITPRFISYERVDLWLGIVLVIVGAVAMMAFCRGGLRRHAGVRQFQPMPAPWPAGSASTCGRAAGVCCSRSR